MQTINSKTRSIFLIALFVLLLSSQMAYAEKTEHTITISENQEWGQIIVEADISQFEVDIVTPDGTTWSHQADHEDDTLFYFSDGSYRHWVAESLKSGTYKVIIEGPANAKYNISNQNSYQQVDLTLASPTQGQHTIDAASTQIEANWQYTGNIMRSNEIQFWLQSFDGGGRFLLKSSFISSNKASLSFSNDIVDGLYKLTVRYDNNTSTPIELDPNVTIEVKRGLTSEQIDIFKLEPAGHGAYAEIKLPQPYSIDTIEVALIHDQSQKPYEWQTYTMSQLEKINAPKSSEYSDAYRDRYGLFIPYEQAGTFKAAVRVIYTNGYPGTIYISEQQVTLEPKAWPENMFTWSVEDGLTNVHYARLEVNSAEATYIMIELNGETILDEQMDSAKQVTTYELPLVEGEQTYVAYAYDELGNYTSDGRIWLVDHTSPRLEMIAPLASHTTLPGQLVSGWTEPGVILTINGKEIEVDETGYFNLETKAKTIDIAVKEASGNETVYHWEAAAAGFDIPWWIVLVVIVIIIVGIVTVIRVKKAKRKQTEEV